MKAMIWIEVSSDGRSKLLQSSQKVTFQNKIFKMVENKYISFLGEKPGMNFLFFSPEMNRNLLLAKVTVVTKENLSVQEINGFAKNFLETEKGWAISEYGHAIPVILQITTNNQNYFFES